MNRHLQWLLLIVAVFLATTQSASARTLKVGPGRPFSRIEKASAAARPGDVILVYPRKIMRHTKRPRCSTAVSARRIKPRYPRNKTRSDATKNPHLSIRGCFRFCQSHDCLNQIDKRTGSLASLASTPTFRITHDQGHPGGVFVHAVFPPKAMIPFIFSVI